MLHSTVCRTLENDSDLIEKNTTNPATGAVSGTMVLRPNRASSGHGSRQSTHCAASVMTMLSRTARVHRRMPPSMSGSSAAKPRHFQSRTNRPTASSAPSTRRMRRWPRSMEREISSIFSFIFAHFILQFLSPYIFNFLKHFLFLSYSFPEN